MEENQTPSSQPPSGKSMMPIILIIFVLLVAAAGYYFATSRGNSNEKGSMMEEKQEFAEGTTESDTSMMEEKDTMMEKGEVKEFDVTGSPFKFDPASITVKKGDTVRINFTNAEGMHDWVIDEFNARTKVIKGGESETIEFVADKAGSFEYYCSVGNHRAQGMVGTLVVEE